MAYLGSSKVKVFPSTRRVATQVDARLITESSMVGIINQLIRKEGFVITDTYGANDPFEFNIYGYYFWIEKGSDLTSLVSGNDVYASIKIDTSNDYHEIKGQDSSSQYQGLIIDGSAATAGSNEIVKSLKILEKVNNNWVIPEASKIMFKEENVDIDIDGGVIS